MNDEYLNILLDPATTQAGGIDDTAIIGRPPEARAWKPGDTRHPVLIHRTARIEAFCTVDSGTFRPTQVGPRSWLMKRVHLGHDVHIGEGCELAPGTVIAGECTLGDRVKCGVNSTVKPCLTVGDDVIIGAGAVITNDVPAGAIVVGNPARLLRWRQGYGLEAVA